MSPTRAVAACAAASVAWLAAFALGARAHAFLPVIGVVAAAVCATVLALSPEVRRMLRPRFRDVLWGIAGGGVSLSATYLLYPLVRALAPAVQGDVRFLYALVPVSAATLPVILVVVVAEELLWRGALQSALAVHHPTASAVVLSSALYAAAQLGLGAPILGAVALGLGLLWAVEASLTGRLVAPLVSHAMWTLTVFGVVPLEHSAS